ncbi:hypothetical protein [Conexibacter woesei]|uniref:hypothetical protein n=1 Tax=Conexibacter woesei TaxID=191495 RepID=UPI0011D1F25A|nr:hypothetical protein [Conexibacter woesei]
MTANALFPDRPRDDPSIAGEEPIWHFLDRVRDPAFDRVRRLLNAWFEEYPPSQREELRARLSSGDNIEFHAAWFELYLHELHRRLGFEILPHPKLPGVTKRPDFQLKSNGCRLLLEATAIGDSEGEGRARRIARIVAAINRTRADDFWLWFEIEHEGAQPPRMRDVRKHLEHWLASLCWEDIRAAQDRTFNGAA